MYSNLLLNEVNLYPELISMLYWLVFCKLYLRHWKYFAKKKVLKVLKFFIHFCWSFTLQHKQLITMDDSVPLSLKKKKRYFLYFCLLVFSFFHFMVSVSSLQFIWSNLRSFFCVLTQHIPPIYTCDFIIHFSAQKWIFLFPIILFFAVKITSIFY